MIQSMTGFGIANSENQEIKVEIEIRSLNSKFLDLNLRFPRIAQNLEMELRNTISKKLKRGKVGLALTLQILDSKQCKRNINAELFKAYYLDIKEISKELPLDLSNLTTTLLNLPDVLESNEAVLSYSSKQLIHETLDNAITKLIEFRKEEGEALKIELLGYSQKIRTHLNKIDGDKQQRIDKLKNKLKDLIDKHLLPENIDTNRFEQELIYYLEKLDITEEIVRLNGHLDYYEREMNREASGKKLQFISQEMGREINTIGSKANDEQIQHLVVEMKEELEKIKEQLLNIL